MKEPKMMTQDPVRETPPLPAQPLALFLDIDGTLAPFAPTPAEACIPAAMLTLLRQLRQSSEGALALISGRNLASIDRMTEDRYPAAGQHGLELRTAQGPVAVAQDARPLLAGIAGELRQWARDQPALVIEDKGLSIAVHYRRAPALAGMVEGHLAMLQAAHPEQLVIQHGKMVGEIRLARSSKGDAIAWLMKTAPFIGRTPVFIGDDATDESGFVSVNAHGGMSIKVGSGATAADWRLETVEDVAAWLHRLALSISPGKEQAA